jgi:pilus assembly protein CpaB
VLESKIAESGLGVASLVKPGMRAFTIETPTTSAGVAGFILPGNRVDVLLTMTKDADSTGGAGTWTLLQNVEILAAGQRLDQSDPSAPGNRLQSVTLLVDPDMATKLTLAQSLGSLTLTLRNDTDNVIADTQPMTLRELRFLQEAVLADVSADPTAEEDADEELPEPAVVSASPAEPPREILALRGSSATIVRVSRISR